jgi:hypothetical protein
LRIGQGQGQGGKRSGQGSGESKGRSNKRRQRERGDQNSGASFATYLGCGARSREARVRRPTRRNIRTCSSPRWTETKSVSDSRGASRALVRMCVRMEGHMCASTASSLTATTTARRSPKEEEKGRRAASLDTWRRCSKRRDLDMDFRPRWHKRSLHPSGAGAGRGKALPLSAWGSSISWKYSLAQLELRWQFVSWENRWFK